MSKDADDDSLPPLGENTDKFLDQAKKGKARNFLLVCKGTKVTFLAVRKKPIKKTELNEAKKAGYKGDGYFGVITGTGMELVFNLAVSDGYESEPVKDKVLKDFLEEQADFKCRPTFAIVATPPEVPFDDEDLENPLVARFLSLNVRVSEVSDANPELIKTTTEIRHLLQSGEFDTAKPLVDALEERLLELQKGAPSEASTAPSTVVDNDALKLKLQEALNKLVPQLKQAVVSYPDKKTELLTPVAQIKMKLESGDLQEAKQGLLAVSQLLKSLMSQSQPPNGNDSKPEDPLRTEYERKLAELQPIYSKALSEMIGDTGKFRSVMAYITEQANASVFGNAIKAIEKLKPAIEQAISLGSVEKSEASKGGAAETSEAEASPAPSEVALRERIAKLEPDYLRVLSSNPSERTRISATMAMAIELVESGEFHRAQATLDRLEKLLENPTEPLAKPTMRKSEKPFHEVVWGEGQLIKYRKALLAWDNAKKAARSQIEGLKSTISSTTPALSQSAEVLDGVMDRLNDELEDAINAAINAEGLGNRAREHDKAGQLARSYLMSVNFDPLFAMVDKNPIQPLSIRATLSAALTQVVAALPM